MLIICPSCATSYQIDAASLGGAGRMVRCARCRATWHAGGPQAEQQQQVSSFVDGVIAEAEAESPPPQPFLRAPPGPRTPPPVVDDSGAGPEFEIHERRFVADDAGAGFTSFGEQSPDIPAPDFTPGAAPTAARRAAREPETIEDAPSVVPPMEQVPEEVSGPGHSADDVESFAARRRRLKSRRRQATRSSRWTAAILVLLALNVALIGGRSEVVRFLPQTASLFAAIGLPVNLQHLKFENVRISPSGTDGNGLAVEGTIVSTASRPIRVPDLRLSARNAAGQEIYTWIVKPDRQLLDTGGKLDFRAELASPPADARDVLVRFLTEQEAAALKSGAMTPKAGQPGAMAPARPHRNPQADQ